MELNHIYHNEIPVFLQEAAATPPMQRLKNVGMNCGCEYTAFPLFASCKPYSRIDHSLGAALIVWHFTGDRKQAIAALLHDIATPVFAHVVDFLRGDYLHQEATEEGTAAMIAASPELKTVLERYGLSLEEVSDYHRYPVADNDSPKLSADRLEYTLGNTVNFGFGDADRAQVYYKDLTVGRNEWGQEELMFSNAETALAFAMDALRCSQVYVCDEDRYAMQRLAELLGDALYAGVLTEADLYRMEPEVIQKLEKSGLSDQWHRFCRLSRTLCADAPGVSGEWRRISAKKRCIDPYIAGQGRVTQCYGQFAEALRAFREQSQDYWMKGD